MRFVVCALAVLALNACSTSRPMQSDASRAFAGASDRYVVVTVHNRSGVLPRAGSSPRDYDRTGIYGLSPAARVELHALAESHRLQQVDGWPIAALGIHCVVFKLPDDVAPADAIRDLSRDARVESVQPLNAFDTLSSDSDPYRSLQRNLDTMQIERAHAWSRGEKTRIAVVDTGIDAKHPDLAGRIAVQRNLVDASAPVTAERHGTAVAGIIAAVENNREGIVGIAPAASLIGLKACWPQTPNAASAVCNTFTLAKALVAALDENSDIVNLSLGGPADPLLQRLVDYGVQRGVIYVGARAQGEAGFPCNIEQVICVGSAGDVDTRAQLFAPGHEVLTLVPDGRYDFLSGSSLASAGVTASIALLRARDRHVTAQIATQLLSPATTDPNIDPARSVNVCDALARLLNQPRCE